MIKRIQPLLFAGIIFEGGITGYDSNIETGGRGARTLGLDIKLNIEEMLLL